MKCEKCNKNQATIYYSKNINGNKSEYHLCSDCAKEMNIFEESNFIQNNFFATPLLSGFDILVNPFHAFDLFFDRNQNYLNTAKVSCPYCGGTFEDFEKTGKFRCAMCYETFKDKVTVTPKKSEKKEESCVDKIAKLRTQLEEAVKTENYEDAAKFRDEIKSLESSM